MAFDCVRVDNIGLNDQYMYRCINFYLLYGNIVRPINILYSSTGKSLSARPYVYNWLF